MTVSIFDKFITKTDSGETIPNASVKVTNTGASVGFAQLWLDRAGTIAAPNPFTADGFGRATFYLTPGRYDVEAESGGTIITYNDTLISSEDQRANRDIFVEGVDFTAGVTTQLTLESAPNDIDNTIINFDGGFIGPESYSLAGDVITFSDPIPVSIDRVYVWYGTALSSNYGDASSITLDIDGTATDVETYLNDDDVASYVALKAIDVSVINDYRTVNLAGRSSQGDGGGGQFYWLSGDQTGLVTLDPNEIVYVSPDTDATGASGVWVRAGWAQSSERGRWGGATGNGTTNDTLAINAVIDFTTATGGGEIIIPEGEYLVSNISNTNHAILAKDNVTLRGVGAGTRIVLDPALDPNTIAFDLRVIATGTFDEAYSNITVSDMYVNANQTAIGGTEGSQTTYLQGAGCALRNEALKTAKNILFENMEFEDVNIGIGYAKNIDDQHSSAARIAAQFFNIQVKGCTVTTAQNKAIEYQETHGSSMNDNVCVDVFDGPQAINSARSVTIENNKVYYKNFGISITHNVKDSTISNNHVECTDAGGGFGSLIFRTESYATESKIENIRVYGNTFSDPINRLNLRFLGKTTNVICEFNDISIYDNTFKDQVNFYEEVYSGSVFNDIKFEDNDVKWTFNTLPAADSEMNDVVLSNNDFTRATTFSGTGWKIKDNVFDSSAIFDADSDSNIVTGNQFKITPATDNGTDNKGILNSNINGTQIWFVQSGAGNTATGTFTFDVPFVAVPNVTLTPQVVAGARMLTIESISNTEFEVSGFNSSGASSNFAFQWMAFGRK